MGISRPILPLWFGQCVTLLGIISLSYLQYQDQLILRELQTTVEDLEHLVELRREAPRQVVSPSGGEEPPEPTKTSVGTGGDPKSVFEVSGTKVSDLLAGSVVSLTGALIFLVLLLVGGAWRLTRVQNQGVLVDSPRSPPSNNRDLALRQLAEIRLRRNGFCK